MFVTVACEVAVASDTGRLTAFLKSSVEPSPSAGYLTRARWATVPV